MLLQQKPAAAVEGEAVTRSVVAEAIGTFVLVFFAVGSAVFGFDKIGPVGVALAFGLVLLALAYAIGPISGCHVNPAVSRGISAAEAGLYVVAQVAGAIVAGGLLKLLVVAGGITDQTGGLGTNSWGKTVNLFGALVVEIILTAKIILTALLVMVVLLVTHADAAPGFAGLAIGLVLTVIHLVGIPLTGTSVNPARSIGPALFAGPEALSQLWLFIIAPLLGAVLAVGVVRGLLTGRTAELTAVEERDPTGAV